MLTRYFIAYIGLFFWTNLNDFLSLELDWY